MDTNLNPKSDIKDFIAYPKDWQREGKQNKPKPFKQYPVMPLIVGKGDKLVPIFLDREGLRPLTFNTAREEADYLAANPETAEKIIEARARQQSASDKLENANTSMRKLAAKHTEVVAERNALETEATNLRDELAAAKAELAAARAQRHGASPQVQTDSGTDSADTPDTVPATPAKRGRPSKAVKEAMAKASEG